MLGLRGTEHPKGAKKEIMALGSHVSGSFLAYQLHSVVQMSGWKFWGNVGPPLTTTTQHWLNIGPMHHVYRGGVVY